MNEWIIQTIPHTARSAYASLVSAEWQILLSADETTLFGASINDLPCGALLARTSDGRFEVVSLIVREENRHQGIATALWRAAEQAAMEQGRGTLDVCYQVSDSENDTFFRYFLRNGFTLPREGSCHYVLSIDQLAHTTLAGLPQITAKAEARIFPLNQIPDADARVSYSYIESKLPAGMRADHAPGQILWEYSIGYVSQKNVPAFVIFCEYEGMLHLHSAYSEHPSNGKLLIALLRKAYDRLMQEPERFTGFRVTTVNSTSEKLVQTLLSGADPVKHHLFYTQKPLTYHTPHLPEWGGVLARSRGLMEVLISHGGNISLVTVPGMLPYMIWQPEKKLNVELFYFVKDPYFTSFTLSAQLPLQAPLETLAAFKQTMEEDPGPATLVPSADATTLTLVAVLTEGAVLNENETVDGFLLPFIEQAKRLLSMLKET